LTLVGINLEDLRAENFNPISDAHLQQDLSAALAWENGTGYVRANTVYIRSHEEGLQEVVDFNPATDKISFFYLSVRGDNQLNFAVEQTDQGVRFYSPITNQSMTLRGIEFSDLNSSHFEWRANQLEDNIAGRMGLSDKIANFRIVNDNVFSGKSVPMAGLVDRAPYHNNPDYTGTRIGSNPPPVDPVDPIEPVDPADPVDSVEPIDPPVDPMEPVNPTDPVDPTPTNSTVNFDIINDWGAGYQGQVNVTNNDSSQLNSWMLEFEFSGKITQIWNAQIVSRRGNTYVISNASYNGTIAPGQDVSFGFLGEGSTSTLPNVFKLNGTVIGSSSIAEADDVDSSIFDAADDISPTSAQTAGPGSPMTKALDPVNRDPDTEPSFEPAVIGTNNGNVIQGNNNNNFILGLGGNDHIKARKGDDTVNGGLGNDHLWGNLGDDTLAGDEGNDTLWGGRGSDNLLGGLNNDILVGSGYFRKGDNSSDVDTFTGGKGADKFILGNRRHAFYTLGGEEDYALITDMNSVEGDTIRLNNQFSYSLGAASGENNNRQELFIDKNGAQELIAVIQTDKVLSLTDSVFTYV
ncbi:MAG: cellulose binding domain-containing protein, partial [Cyanobacteria bacterium P01_F01_bin.13]